MRIKFLGELGMKVGKEVEIEVGGEVAFDELIKILEEKFPQAKEEFKAIDFYMVSVNGKIVRRDEIKNLKFSDKDEIIFLPSIAGGSVKAVIGKNFDLSVSNYDDFERKYGFFERLARDLAEFSKIKGRCLDVGCGTGIFGKIWKEAVGLDVAKNMARKAREFMRDVVVGDAANLPFKSETFDSTVFNATIFLLPDAEKAVEEALRVTKKEGIVSGSYLVGFFKDGEDALAKIGLKHRVPYGRYKLEKLLSNFNAEISYADYVFTKEAVMDFYSIPAMANGLFPKEGTLEEKVLMARERLRNLPDNVVFRWGFFKIRK